LKKILCKSLFRYTDSYPAEDDEVINDAPAAKAKSIGGFANFGGPTLAAAHAGSGGLCIHTGQANDYFYMDKVPVDRKIEPQLLPTVPK
jgi:hypothetical protein